MGRLGPCAFFTAAGLTALRQLVLDRRYINPDQFALKLDEPTVTGA
jgi:hypothetical protein